MTDIQQFVSALSATLEPSFAAPVGILLSNARLNDFVLTSTPDSITWINSFYCYPSYSMRNSNGWKTVSPTLSAAWKC